jgi:hypothetical protein
VLRYLASAAVLALVAGLSWLVVDVYLIGDSDAPEASSPRRYTFIPDCRDQGAACQTIIATYLWYEIPTPRPDLQDLVKEMRAVVFADPNIRAIVDGKVEGTDYWVDVVPYRFPIFHEDGGTLWLLFRNQVSFSGEILLASDPCHEFEYQYRYENLDPCQSEQRDFSTTTREFQTRAVWVWVDVLTDRVFNIASGPAEDATVDDMIDALRQREYSDPPDTPTEPGH